MRASERIARLSDRLFDRLRDKRAFMVTDDQAVDGDFDALRRHTYALLVTFRRKGDAVPSPVWCGVDANGRVYLKTAGYAGKVKRIRHDHRVLIAPSNARGKPMGPAIRGIGRVLPRDEWAHAEETLVAAHGTTRRMFELVLGGGDDSAAYIEITPR